MFKIKLLSIGLCASTASATSSLPSGRLNDYSHDPTILASIDTVTREKYIAQEAIDIGNDRLIAGWNEALPDSVPFGDRMIPLNKTSIRELSPNSVEFDVVNDLTRLVKIAHDCRLDSVGATKMVPHPLLREFWLGSTAAAANVTASFYSISPAVPIRQGLFPSLSEDQVRQCQLAGASVRFYTFHKPRGLLLREHLMRQPLQRYPPRYALLVGVRLISLVRDLHSVGIIHGNLGLDDIYLWTAPDGRFGGVLLNIFSSPRTTWIDRQTGLSNSLETYPPPVDGEEHLQSPWELVTASRRHQYGIRDDMYRAVQLVSTMLNGIGHVEYLKTIARFAGSLAEHKLMTPVLHASPQNNPLSSLPISMDALTRIHSSMFDISSKVLEPCVAYEDIIRKLTETFLIVNGRARFPGRGANEQSGPNVTTPSPPKSEITTQQPVRVYSAIRPRPHASSSNNSGHTAATASSKATTGSSTRATPSPFQGHDGSRRRPVVPTRTPVNTTTTRPFVVFTRPLVQQPL